MKIEFYNCPEPEALHPRMLPEASAFLSYQPNFAEIQKIIDKYAQHKNLLIIGHGGSVTSFYGMYHGLHEQATKQVYFLSTVDPDYIAELKKFLSPADTLVISISKSGENVTQLEASLQFTGFPLIFIAGALGPLAQLAEQLSAKLILHPPAMGRFSGLTEVGLLPAALCGFDIKAMHTTAVKHYQKFAESNEAIIAASIGYQLEQKGIVDVFMPVYDTHLFPMTNLVIQLCHESFGKDGKGQTYFAHPAPESQHHTNQRFFGGRKNIAGWFLSSDKPLTDIVTVVPDSVKTIALKSSTMGVLDGISLSTALHNERDATMEDAKLQNIPVINQTISERTAGEIGSLIAFWQLYAIYSAVLRGVNPFDQPQVENSKRISFDKRLQQKGLL